MQSEERQNGVATIRFLSGPLVGKSISIQKATTSFGRGTQNDIVVLDPAISRQHASIHWNDGVWLIENPSQSNYVTINQQRVKQQGILQHNCLVSLGGTIRFVFLLPQAVAEQQQPSAAQILEQAKIADLHTLRSPLNVVVLQKR